MTDYIKREDAILAITRNHDEVLSVADAIEDLESVHSADIVERKRGEWFDRGSLSCRCSNCGCKSTKEYSFCPNCGADMRGRKDG